MKGDKCKMKYFYTDSLKAAWMARVFEVPILVENLKYEPHNGTDPYKWSTNTTGIIDWWHEGKINPDYYHLFKPEVGDVIIDNHGEPRLITEVRNDEVIWYSEESFDWCYITNVQIIQRNGKAFFMPEVSND